MLPFFKNIADSVETLAKYSVKSVEDNVLDPAGSFVKDSAKSVEDHVLNPIESFGKDTVKYVEDNVIKPVASIIDPIFTRQKDIDKELHKLDKLQEHDGSHFPGHDYRPSDRKNWMAGLKVDKLTLNKIVWPGTHDSATNRIGYVFGISGPFTPFGECQTLSIYDQLVIGTRVLDIRIQEDRLVCHGSLNHYHVDVVLNDVIRFLSETQSEIVVLEIRTEYGESDPPGFEDYLISKLGEVLIHQDDDLFNKSISEILRPRRVICIWKPRNSPKLSLGGPLWNSDYLRDDWVKTDLPLTKFNENMKNLTNLPPVSSRHFFYRTENTLTPQMDNTNMDVKTVTGNIRNRARLFISQCISKGCGDKLQILSTDFIEEDFIDACVGLTHARIDGEV